MRPAASILLFGGLAKDRPYPGSTTVSSVNGGVTGMVHTLAVELAPLRINAIHPGIVGDSPMWRDNAAMLENVAKRTPIGRAVTMDEIVGACLFLLENGGVNGVTLAGVVGRENVQAGTDCGFDTFIRFSQVDPDVVWLKLQALSEGAEIASRELWG